MTDTTDSIETTRDDGTNPLRRAKDAVVVAKAARELSDAIDSEDLRAASAGDSVDVDQLADALGRPIGRLLAHHLVDDTGVTGYAKRTVAERVGRSVSTKTFRIVVENVDTEALAETVVELDEETLPGPALTEYVASEPSTRE